MRRNVIGTNAAQADAHAQQTLTARLALGILQSIAYLKHSVEALRRARADNHLAVERPWGSYTVLEEGRRHKVKRITVTAGQRLSLQKHFHRSEHWVVTEGTARVTCGTRVFDLHVNESTIIPREAPHRLANPGPGRLEIIEIQNGAYLGEDDIVRLADDYGRASA